MIKQTVSESHFIEALMSDEHAGWTLGAARALYEYYEQLSDDIGENIELDRVAIRCDWSEYPSALEYAKQHTGGDLSGLNIDWLDAEQAEDAEQLEQAAREWLEECTQVLDVENIDTSANEYRTAASILVAEF